MSQFDNIVLQKKEFQIECRIWISSSSFRFEVDTSDSFTHIRQFQLHNMELYTKKQCSFYVESYKIYERFENSSQIWLNFQSAMCTKFGSAIYPKIWEKLFSDYCNSSCLSREYEVSRYYRSVDWRHKKQKTIISASFSGTEHFPKLI